MITNQLIENNNNNKFIFSSLEIPTLSKTIIYNKNK